MQQESHEIRGQWSPGLDRAFEDVETPRPSDIHKNLGAASIPPWERCERSQGQSFTWKKGDAFGPSGFHGFRS